MTGNHESTPSTGQQPVFHRVAEILYRLESSGGYYALVKKGGKQFRRSLRTKDRKLAERMLQELKARIGGLIITEDANLASSLRIIGNELFFERRAALWSSTGDQGNKGVQVAND